MRYSRSPWREAKCIKCDASRWELVEGEVKDSAYRMYFVQCRSCGGVVGTVPFYNTHQALKKIAEKLGVRLSD